MQIDIVTNKEIARRLRISESKACRLVRLYRDAHSLPKYSPVEWVKFYDFLGLEVKPSQKFHKLQFLQPPVRRSLYSFRMIMTNE